jgi:3-phenylpropionate/trans-cinnamate dioxygenase ferredoxin reductase subunit
MSPSPSLPDRSVDFLLVGGGMASANCARWLRRSGAEGSIVIVGREGDLPYERPPLSKGYLRGKEQRGDALAHPAEFYVENEIEVLTRTSVMKIDPGRREASLSNKRQLGFERVLLATGANVRRLNVPGAELEGIHYLRTFANSDAIRADAAGKRVVLIGGSYIAAEVAASLTEMGTDCSLVMLEPVVLSRSFGEPAARFFHDLLVQHGIEICGPDSLARFEGADGRVQRVVTESGRTLEADAVIVGAGVVPDVMLARSAGLELGHSGGIRVDSQLQTETPGVFAAGDVAEYESVIHGGRRIRVEHWDVAFNQGKVAALNMLGREHDYDVVPYFFSDLSDWASIEYVGPAHDWDREVFRGSVDAGEFSVFYLDGGRMAAALSVGRSSDLQVARRLIASGEDISGREDQLADLSTDLDEF